MRRHLLHAALVACVLPLTACVSYSPKPIDLPAYRAAWESRPLTTPPEAGSGPLNLSDGVSLREAEVVALLWNAELRTARAAAGVTLATAEHAGHWEDPMLEADVQRVLQASDMPLMGGVGLRLTLPVSGRLEAEKAMAASEHGMELAKVVALEWETRIRIREAWAEFSAESARVEAVQEYLGHLDSVAALAERLVAAGELTRPQWRLFEIDRTMQRAELLTGQGRIRESRLSLLRLMGVAPASQLQCATADLTAGFGVRQPSLDAPHRHPSVLVAITAYEAAERRLNVEIRRQYPDLTLAPGFVHEDGSGRAGLGVGLTLPLWNRNQQGIAEALAARESAGVAMTTRLEAVLAETAAAREGLEFKASSRDLIRGSLIPLVDQQDADVLRQAQATTLEPMLLLETLARRRAARLQLIDADLEVALAQVRLGAALGPAGDTP